MGQSGVLNEGMQLSFLVHALACKFNLAQFLYVAPVPVIFVVFVVVASNEAAAEVLQKLDQKILAIIVAKVLCA